MQGAPLSVSDTSLTLRSFISTSQTRRIVFETWKKREETLFDETTDKNEELTSFRNAVRDSRRRKRL
jgi:hypothetical protein